MPSEPFSGLCVITQRRDGERSIRVLDHDGFQRALTQYGAGEELSLTVGPESRTRSAQANRFFHGPVLKAFEAMGWRKQEAKDMLCLRFIPHETRTMEGYLVRVPGHTSELTIEAFNEFLDACIQLAAENDQVILDPQDWRARQTPATKGAA